MFPPVPYLEWIEGRPAEARFDLGSSDLRPRARPTGDANAESDSSDGVVPGPLIGLPHPAGGGTLAAEIADAYGVDSERVLVTAGATHANFLAAAAALEVAAESSTAGGTQRPQVLVEKPAYGPMVSTPEALGGRVDRFLRSPDAAYRLDPPRIGNAATEAFALAVITNRHNPSGRLSPLEALAAASSTVAERGGYLLVDEVYAPYARKPDVEAAAAEAGREAVRPFGGVTAAGLPNTIVTSSFTKFFGLGGLRIGWVVGPADIVDRARRIMHHVPTVSDPSVALGRRAFHHRESLATDVRALLTANHDRLAAFVDERSDVSGRVSPGCTYAFLRHDGMDGDAVADAAWERDVLVVPGRFFDDPSAFRLSAGRPTAEVDEGLAILEEVLDE